VREAAFDLYFQKSLKPRRCQREPRLRLNDDEDLFPGVYHPGQKHQEHPIRFRACWPFHLAPEDNQRLSQQGVFSHQLRLATGLVGQCSQQERGGVRCGPGNEAVVERPKTQACQPRDEGEDPLHCKTLPLCKDEQVNACDCTLPLCNRQGARGMIGCSHRPILADGYHK